MQLRNISWDGQLKSLVEAYLDWDFRRSETPAEFSADILAERSVRAIGLHGKLLTIYLCFELTLCTGNTIVRTPVIAADTFPATSFIRHGLFPCAPQNPTVAIHTTTLEYYCVLSLRCPRLSIQAFTKALCNLHGTFFRPYLREQFAISFDLYLSVRAQVRASVSKALGRDDPDWRLKNTCPCCQYKLKCEPPMTFDMLATMDGNNSLKRLLRREVLVDKDGERTTGNSSERLDLREGGGDYFLSQSEVDKWDKEVLKLRPKEQETEAVNDEPPPCERDGNWKNMNAAVTVKMWGVFDETSIFLSLCQHGFVLLVVDMVQSGEL